MKKILLIGSLFVLIIVLYYLFEAGPSQMDKVKERRRQRREQELKTRPSFKGPDGVILTETEYYYELEREYKAYLKRKKENNKKKLNAILNRVQTEYQGCEGKPIEKMKYAAMWMLSNYGRVGNINFNDYKLNVYDGVRMGLDPDEFMKHFPWRRMETEARSIKERLPLLISTLKKNGFTNKINTGNYRLFFSGTYFMPKGSFLKLLELRTYFRKQNRKKDYITLSKHLCSISWNDPRKSFREYIFSIPLNRSEPNEIRKYALDRMTRGARYYRKKYEAATNLLIEEKIIPEYYPMSPEAKNIHDEVMKSRARDSKKTEDELELEKAREIMVANTKRIKELERVHSEAKEQLKKLIVEKERLAELLEQESQADKNTGGIQETKKKLEQCKNKIAELKDYFNNLPQVVEIFKKKIKKNELKVAEIQTRIKQKKEQELERITPVDIDVTKLPKKKINSKGIELILVKPGVFQMGSDRGGIHEKPAHTVKIIRPFYMGKHEITIGQYLKYLESIGEKTEEVGWGKRDCPIQYEEGEFRLSGNKFGKHKKQPMTCISRKGALEFCEWLTKQENRKYRLPTEAEWEYACKAGTETKYFYGHSREKLDEYAWYYENSNQVTHKVGGKSPNPWGFCDIYGNVYEWCLDVGIRYYSEGDMLINPIGAKDSDRLLVRGGDSMSYPSQLRSSSRESLSSDRKMVYIGFRVVQDVSKDFDR